MQPLLDFVKRGNLQTELFSVGLNQHLVTSIHENWFCARCINSTKPEGEGVIVMQIGACLLVTMYAGSLAAASQAMVAADQFAIQFNRRSH
nr:unknown [Zea mays]